VLQFSASNYGPSGTLYFYSITGQRLALCTAGYPTQTVQLSASMYFGARPLKAMDRLGSVRYDNWSGAIAYYPWGEERTSTADGTDKFATYFRDGFGQDYANARYYNSNLGRFWSPDPMLTGAIATAFRPSLGAVNPGDPTTWNQYAYVGDDPANRHDPTGLDSSDPDCSDLLTKINRVFFGSDSQLNPSKGLMQRFYEQIYGAVAPGQTGWQTHEDQIVGLQKRLKRLMKNFTDDKCPPPPNWNVFDKWANKPAPSATDYKGPVLNLNMFQWLLGTAGVAIFYQMLPELEDAFQNALPVIQQVAAGIAESEIYYDDYGGDGGGDWGQDGDFWLPHDDDASARPAPKSDGASRSLLAAEPREGGSLAVVNTEIASTFTLDLASRTHWTEAPKLRPGKGADELSESRHPSRELAGSAK
jgi:RHS repeat-associated protein